MSRLRPAAALLFGMHAYFLFHAGRRVYLVIDTTVGERVCGSHSFLAIVCIIVKQFTVNAATFLRNTSLGLEKNT
jgi:hypothetical protein